jgi:hypothetical protein
MARERKAVSEFAAHHAGNVGKTPGDEGDLYVRDIINERIRPYDSRLIY